MFEFRRWWLLCGAVLVGVVALNGVVNGVVDAKAAPARGAVCVRGGATARDGVSGRGLVCVQTKVRGLRWRFQPTTLTTTTTTTATSSTTTTSTSTTTMSGVVAPVLVSVSASDGVRITVAGMRPDTGVYSLQWVPYGQSFNTYQMARATSPSMSVPAGWFACNRTYTFRVFVMQADWQLADGHQRQNVTPHSTLFDVVMPACIAPTPATTPAAPVTCADGGACVVGDTGPGGGIVFYVQAAGGTFDCGVALTSTCKYLEAAPTGWGNGITVAAGETTGTSTVDPRLTWCSNRTSALGTTATAIGTGMANTTTADGTCTSGAIQSAADYTNNGKTDWHLPSKDELNELCKYAKNQPPGTTATVCAGTGVLRSSFSSADYWSSSEFNATSVWGQAFYTVPGSNQYLGSKDINNVAVRPVRAFGGTLACADGATCAIGDTGPGGGIVFYVHPGGGTFACGATLASACKYLEVAPSGWNTGADPTKLWAIAAHQSSDVATITNDSSAYNNASGIGLGYKNSVAIVIQGNDTTTAAGAARAYGGGAQSDWYLPTTAELNLLCQWARGVAQSVTTVCTGGGLNTGTGASGGFSAGAYWSSSEGDADDEAWGQNFDNGVQGGDFKDTTYSVRPVRAFGGTIACADGGVCAVGDTGPGGGIVFYVSADPFTSTGSDCNTTCKYLEAAPAPVGGDVTRSWATDANLNRETAVPAPGARALGIGSGMENTIAIKNQTGNVAATSAAVYAFDYMNNGKTDWHLPSQAELNELFLKKATVGGFSADFYWSSSEIDASYAWGQGFDFGAQFNFIKYDAGYVRPVRAFG